MVSSVMGFVLNYNVGNTNAYSLRYNGHTFQLEDNVYTTKINGEEHFFYSAPDTAQFIEFPDEFVPILKEAPAITFTQDINDTNNQLITALHYELTQYTKKVYIGAYTTNESTRPQVTCDSQGPIIYAHSAEQTNVTWDGNCLNLALTPSDVPFYRDVLIYHYYGVLE